MAHVQEWHHTLMYEKKGHQHLKFPYASYIKNLNLKCSFVSTATVVVEKLFTQRQVSRGQCKNRASHTHTPKQTNKQKNYHRLILYSPAHFHGTTLCSLITSPGQTAHPPAAFLVCLLSSLTPRMPGQEAEAAAFSPHQGHISPDEENYHRKIKTNKWCSEKKKTRNECQKLYSMRQFNPCLSSYHVQIFTVLQENR